jgi:hypothetical protein
MFFWKSADSGFGFFKGFFTSRLRLGIFKPGVESRILGKSSYTSSSSVPIGRRRTIVIENVSALTLAKNKWRSTCPVTG